MKNEVGIGNKIFPTLEDKKELGLQDLPLTTGETCGVFKLFKIKRFK